MECAHLQSDSPELCDGRCIPLPAQCQRCCDQLDVLLHIAGVSAQLQSMEHKQVAKPRVNSGSRRRSTAGSAAVMKLPGVESIKNCSMTAA
jgi:hypothetical protein